ncbi:MAG: orotidine-5'-phosphate decarboxylase [Candidatus Magasanikbacteria bacterium]|jgi:orotidine 5'-phosphate decarboxylase subfamily 1|nr:orotidine-5'-phosphate decarboxylase [Candidatus Magasanikbacteria bacterium]
MLTYIERVKSSSNPTAKILFELMDSKQTNLCVAADVTSKAELLRLADLLGPEICVFKTHIDIVEDFDVDLVLKLQTLAAKHNFLIFEDRKFADIGKTVQLQYQKGIYHIADWSHITNAHTVAGPGSIEALKEVGLPKGRGLLVLAEMSPKGTLAKGTYTEESIVMAKNNRDFVIGFIATHQLTEEPEFIHMTPGVQLKEGTDAFGQQFLTPDTVIRERKCDVIIVGRGITSASDPLAEAKKYRAAGWQAYKNRF